MIEVKVEGNSGNSSIFIGESYKNVGKYLPQRQIFVVIDENVKRLYGSFFDQYQNFTIGSGEEHKTLQTVESAYRWLLDNNADRSSFILAIGGGLTCDVAGFIASTFMRGIGFGFISTTLLSQVDASVGGKNGVNLDGYKNIIGTFNQPKFVICDPEMLMTLEDRDYISGLAEIVKHTLLADKSMFEYIERNYEKLLARDRDAINMVVENSVKIKASVVSRDEREKGERRKLNLGHTWGHAVEKTTHRPHGESVSIGLAFAAKLSVLKGLLSQNDSDRIEALLNKLHLPTTDTFDKSKAFAYMLKDKKKEQAIIHFVLINGIGDAVVEPMDKTQIETAFKTLEGKL